ncbi:putative membrane transport protein [[Actinomadura] parvosata subsp. kistnae]|uniref:MFS transporter n=1 Tax=[Actinomadura] parvosata subsp. kistnae TaxID=1909395 RepID=A0A1V0AH63_9ACTN|nr:MFS transporter [Nonomuraea sp. ATCC 55076]AQZ69422.1 MFS transporter [Nonomuraea sp. ATCC 55076]SPL91934.1 putative membrane transport protein [Actinomadura parvosata subsp. kistnae]
MATVVVPESRETTRLNPWPGVISLAFAASIAALQNTAVVPLLPVLQRELNTSLTAVSWTLTLSLLVGAVSTPLLSRFGDMYGRRRMILGALALLVIGSVMAALATSLTWLIVARVLQGFVAALVPLSIGVVRDALPRQQLATGIGVLSATMGFGSGGGMILAGLASGDFHLVFWITGGISLVAGIVVAFLVRDAAPPVKGRPDLLGAALLTAWLVALLLAVSEGGSWGWTSPGVLGLLAAAAVLAAVWVLVERRVAEPLVQMAMLVHRGTVGATVSSLLLGFSFFTLLTGMSGFAQVPAAAGGFGATTLQVGIYLLPSTFFMLVISLFAGRIMRRLPASAMVATGSGITALAGLWLVIEHTAPVHLYVASSLMGMGLGVGYAALGTMAVEHVAADRTAVAAGVNALVRIVGGSVAGAAIAAVLAAGGGYPWVFGAAAVAGVVAALFAAGYGYLNRGLVTAPSGH